MGLYDLINPISYYTNLNGAINDIRNQRLLFGGAYFNFFNFWTSNIFANPYQSPWQLNITANPYQNNSIWNFNNPIGFNVFKISYPNWSTPANNNNPFANMNSIWSNNIFYPTYNFTGTINQSEKISDVKNTETITKTSTDTNNKTTTKSSYMGQAFVNNAKKYLGYNEKDGSSNKFSNSGEWCADFVTYVVKESYKSKGLKPPEGFGNHEVEKIKQWGINNNQYLDITSSDNKAKDILNNVRVGDIMILRENGASHTGFVSKIYKNGSFETIEGNRDDKVTTFKYSPTDKRLSGFVQLN